MIGILDSIFLSQDDEALTAIVTEVEAEQEEAKVAATTEDAEMKD